MIQSIDVALIKQAAGDHKTIGTIGTAETFGTGFVQIVMELLHRHRGLKVSVVYRVLDGLNGLNCLNEQRLIAERFGGLDEYLVGRDRRAIREKIETEPKIRNWFQDLTRLSTYSKSRFDRQQRQSVIAESSSASNEKSRSRKLSI